ncbi:hypothetical protein [Stutzerimonas stutzeri]|uniref:hypothetical protein n=1 Tax=Stutzerimonas stutzeri TaxID=316 RepID=UPI001C2E9DE4|nr:hypothetical protein [Stutzerimonas stutzeri]
MNNRLNTETQIWADGYSFMEVTETLLMALGIRTESQPPGARPDRVEPSATADEDLQHTETNR